ncbi:MAG: ATP synthase F1 subunit gamma, partial [Candidatus Eremiobacteraeota bacterium]|nr:ATP synthase F1 subunit gamma [Candidatus Eremiobacteraeota bacterium]
QQICRAMKMVASVRIRNAERKMKASKPYTARYREIVGELMAQSGEVYHPLMEVRPVSRTLLVIITSDKGLCGAYNSNIFQEGLKYLKDRGGDSIILWVLGNKGVRFFSRRGCEMEKKIINWEPSYEFANSLSRELQRGFLDRLLDQVLCLYSIPVSTMVQKPGLFTLLPLVATDTQCAQKCLQICFEPPPAVALGHILPIYMDVILYQILMEAKVAEIGARLRAMTSATDNAEDLIGDLKLQFFRARQESITTEILEVTGGAEALRQGG